MSRKGMTALLCASLLLGSGCTSTPRSEGGSTEYLVYYSALADPDSQYAVAGESHTIPAQEETISALLALLLEPPETPGLTSPLPAGLRLLEWQLEEGQLHLDFSEQYYTLSGVDMALADACLSLTFCQLEEVSDVYVTVEGREIPYRPIQQLSANDILLTGGVDEPLELWVDLRYLAADGPYLDIERRKILKQPEQTIPQAVLAAWADGTPAQTGLPEDIQIRSVTLQDGICIVDLSPSFPAALSQESQATLMIYAMVNTLCQLEGIEAVQLYVEGQPAPPLGALPLDQPLLPDPALEQ